MKLSLAGFGSRAVAAFALALGASTAAQAANAVFNVPFSFTAPNYGFRTASIVCDSFANPFPGNGGFEGFPPGFATSQIYVGSGRTLVPLAADGSYHGHVVVSTTAGTAPAASYVCFLQYVNGANTQLVFTAGTPPYAPSPESFPLVYGNVTGPSKQYANLVEYSDFVHTKLKPPALSGLKFATPQPSASPAPASLHVTLAGSTNTGEISVYLSPTKP